METGLAVKKRISISPLLNPLVGLKLIDRLREGRPRRVQGFYRQEPCREEEQGRPMARLPPPRLEDQPQDQRGRLAESEQERASAYFLQQGEGPRRARRRAPGRVAAACGECHALFFRKKKKKNDFSNAT